jgi:hypothetical protein
MKTNMNMKTLAVILSCVLGGTLFASTASAQGYPPGNAFGAPGQWAITGDFEGHIRNGWELRLHPSLDYFIAPNVSVGGLVGLTYDSGNPSTTTLDLGARAGYNINVADRVSFWPKVGIIYHHFSSGGNSSSSTSLELFAPFLFHVVPHLFLGVGPFFDLPLDSGGNSYGLQTVVGGWF